MLLAFGVGDYCDSYFSVPPLIGVGATFAVSAANLALAASDVALAAVRTTSPSMKVLMSDVQAPTIAPQTIVAILRGFVMSASEANIVRMGVRKPMVPYSQGARLVKIINKNTI